MKIFTLIILINSSFVWSISPDSNHYFEIKHEMAQEEKLKEESKNRLPSADKIETKEYQKIPPTGGGTGMSKNEKEKH